MNVMDKFSLTGKTALVTGGAGLLGRQFSKALGQAGAKILVADTDGKASDNQVEKLKADDINAIFVETDITDTKSVNNLVGLAVSNFGSLDVLVNSAALDPKFDADHIGQQSDNAFETFPIDMWNEALSVNLTGMFLVCQAAAKQMIKQGSGVIINICSTYGLVGPDQRIYKRHDGTQQFKPVHYSVTKAGVLGLTKYLSTYFAEKHIRVNALTPGGIYNQHDDTFLKAYSARTVMGRMAHEDEMNGAIVFLASDASSYMTGANLVVDGGWTAW